MYFNRYYSPSIFQWQAKTCFLLLFFLVSSLFISTLPTLTERSFIATPLQPQLMQLVTTQPDTKVKVIVQKLNSNNNLEQVATELGGVVTKDLSIIHAFVTEIAARQLPTLARSEGVRWISLDAPVAQTDYSCGSCIDSSKLRSAYDSTVKADKVWNQTVNGLPQPWLQGQGIGVAVLDSGIVSSSPDFQNNNGMRVVANVKTNTDSWLNTDQFGHGTHVAGIVGGTGASSQGAYIGIAPSVNLVSVKVSDDIGMSTASDVVSGLQWVLNNKTTYNIRVVNLSLNSGTYDSYNTDPLDAACEILWFNGIVVVVSAGNKGTSSLYPPANDPFVITVGATDDKGTSSLKDDSVAGFSSYGSTLEGYNKPDLVAPGTNIVSIEASPFDTLVLLHPANQLSGPLNGLYFRMSGTSMSAPVVSGAVALLLQSEPNLNPDQVKYRLKATAVQNKARGAWDTRATWPKYDPVKAGGGYLDIYAAVTQKTILNTANTGTLTSQLLWKNGTATNWSSVNWSTVNWSTVNWSTVNWSTVNWSSDYWGS